MESDCCYVLCGAVGGVGQLGLIGALIFLNLRSFHPFLEENFFNSHSKVDKFEVSESLNSDTC